VASKLLCFGGKWVRVIDIYGVLTSSLRLYFPNDVLVSAASALRRRIAFAITKGAHSRIQGAFN
jgi:hypothetical protein